MRHYIPHLMLAEIYNTQAKLEQCILREHTNKIADEFIMTFRAFLLNKHYTSFCETNKEILKKTHNITLSTRMASCLEYIQQAIAQTFDVNASMTEIIYQLNIMAKALNDVVSIIIRNDIAASYQIK